MQDLETPRYEDDLYSWSLAQADKLRELQQQIGNLPGGVDFDHLIEEVEGLGARERRILLGHIRQIIVHMAGIAFVPSEKASRNTEHWLTEIQTFRQNIVDLFEVSPGLKGQLDEFCTDQWLASTEAALLKISQISDGGLTAADTRDLRNRMHVEVAPTANEVLGFDIGLHLQKSKQTIQNYIEADTLAPRFPAFVTKALERLSMDQ